MLYEVNLQDLEPKPPKPKLKLNKLKPPIARTSLSRYRISNSEITDYFLSPIHQ
jgi:hypothetical protein